MAKARRGGGEITPDASGEELAAALLQRLGYAPEGESPDRGARPAPTPPPRKRAPDPAKPAEEPWDYVCLADVERRPVRWMWPDKIAYGKLTVVAGDGDKGKSWAMLDLAARLSTGTPMPGETERPEVASTVLLMGEDDAADTIGPRFDSQRGNSRRIFLLRGVRRRGTTAVVRLQRDIDLLEGFVRHTDARLLVIDGMASYMGGTDGINEIDVRQTLMPLTAMAQRTGAAVVAIMHRNKGEHRNPLHAIAGSIAFGNVARCVLGVADDDQSPGRRVMVPIKGNIIRVERGAGYRIQDFVLQWDSEPVTVTKETIFADRTPNGHKTGEDDEDDGSKRGRARQFLRTVLEHHDGRWPMRRIFADAQPEIKEKTLRRAKLDLRVQEDLIYEEDGHHRWWWRLPTPEELEELKREEQGL